MSGRKTRHIKAVRTEDNELIVINNETRMFWWLPDSPNQQRYMINNIGYKGCGVECENRDPSKHVNVVTTIVVG